ncbi:MAG: hypothetical protein ABIC91_06375 [Nanoarchaeota archaeon]|nr:hypothetical protein [Nanoarchaeota archaeon]MBU1030400.1 hypothetical protein [Nanoarchaeota archaeon]MBU1850022.1 hypothetical protein [Nanoarchaeota archaeon]
MAESVFRGTIEFLNEIGIYDVVLPFLLVFTIVFAILEKTKVYGVEEVEGKKYTKKNLNAMTAFVVSFFVVASSKLVEVILKVSSQVVVLLLLSILFLMLAGSFHKDEEFYLQKGWNTFFMVLMFIGIVFIFLNALGWLDTAYEFLSGRWDTNAVSAIILLAVVVGFMFYVTRDSNSGKKKKETKED